MIPSSTLLDVSDFFVPHRILTSPVSIHAPTWGATYANANNASSNSFQSTLPHGERQASAAFSLGLFCFNPRSRMGSDQSDGRDTSKNRCFNPRSRMGSDSCFVDLFVRQIPVSTHAPAWGATRHAKSNPHCVMFQPTLPHGERLRLAIPLTSNAEFQPTLPHGERQTRLALLINTSMFQPTLPHGERRALARDADNSLLFQPTLPHGERHLPREEIGFLQRVSTHAPAWGATVAFNISDF